MDLHYILTLTVPVGGGQATVTFNGVFAAHEGQTRQEIFGLIYQHAVERAHMSRPDVAFFDLAPNTLPSAGDWPTAATCGGQTR
jgi:hypothetical protein